jgi:DNA adenine methylase
MARGGAGINKPAPATAGRRAHSAARVNADSPAPPLKWHGGKHFLAHRIVALMPHHLHYVEPYLGGGSVLLVKPPDAVSEVVNDIDGRLTNFWRVLQDPGVFEQFRRRLEATPFSEVEWRAAGVRLSDADSLERAVAFFIRCRQSLAGRMVSFAPITRTRLRRGMNEQASAWSAAIEGLPAVHARLARVVILNRPALEVIRGQDGEQTLFYLDPPYLHETRAAPGTYAHEMSERDLELLKAVRCVSGMVMLSGYPSALYDDWLAGWRCYRFQQPNHAASGPSKRRMTECVWTNFEAKRRPNV